jgi:hypothetical protein
MENPIPRILAQFTSLGAKMHTGLVKYAEVLGLKQVTPAEFQTSLDNLVAADGAYNSARTAAQVLSDAYQATLTALSNWLQTTRNVLAANFGPTWSSMWLQAGFINNSTSVPARIGEKTGLAANLATFFGTHPSYEQPTLGVTKAQAELVRSNALAAQAAWSAGRVVQKQKSDERDSAYESAASLMRTVIKNLAELLDPMDPRWLEFGLNMPGADGTPSQPINVQAGIDPITNNVLVTCDAVAMTTRYRARMKRLGIDPDYVLVASGPAPMLTVPGLLPGQTAEITMEAVNGSSAGVPSMPVQVTIPVKAAAEVASATPAPVSLPASVAAPLTLNGNGSRNGHIDLVSRA